MTDASQRLILDALFQGEPALLRLLASGDPSIACLPQELIELAGLDDSAPAARIVELSQRLRRHCIQAPTAAESVLLGSIAVLRLASLGHESLDWSPSLSRWMVPALPQDLRAVGLLALAVDARDGIAPEAYAEDMDKALAELPPDCQLRASHLYQYALFLGLRGMLRRLVGVIDLPHPGDQEPEVADPLVAECYFDAVCCGRVSQASFLDRQLARLPAMPGHEDLFRIHHVHLQAFGAIIAGRPIPESADLPSRSLLRALIERDVAVLAEISVSGSADDVSPLLSFDGLRCALACRDLGKARGILDSRAGSPAQHWLDDFFLARLLLLEDRPGEAGAAFARVEAAATRYGAIERLEIELRLAGEMSLHDCCRLGLLGCRQPSTTSIAPRVPLPDGPAILLGRGAAGAGLREGLSRLNGRDPVLLLGPDDGSRPEVAACIHQRTGTPGRLTCLQPDVPAEEWSDRLAAGIAEAGTLLVDGLDRLSPAQQHRLIELLDRPYAARLLCGAAPVLPALAAAGRWSSRLYWALATGRIDVPTLAARTTDLPDILLRLLAEHGLHLPPSAALRSTLERLTLPGGWGQLTALARMASARAPAMLDATHLSAMAAELARGYEAPPA